MDFRNPQTSLYRVSSVENTHWSIPVRNTVITLLMIVLLSYSSKNTYAAPMLGDLVQIVRPTIGCERLEIASMLRLHRVYEDEEYRNLSEDEYHSECMLISQELPVLVKDINVTLDFSCLETTVNSACLWLPNDVIGIP